MKAAASPAQARLIARFWGTSKFMPVGGYVDPTQTACVKNGWFVGTGVVGKYPSGTPFEEYQVSDAGLLALENFLREARFKNRHQMTYDAGRHRSAHMNQND